VRALAGAVAVCVVVGGTRARTGGRFRRQTVGPPDEVAPRLIEAAAGGPVALVFGPEPTGLSNDEVMRCHYLINVPADPAYPALNLAQAVAVCTYELRRAWLRAGRPAAGGGTGGPVGRQGRSVRGLGGQ